MRKQEKKPWEVLINEKPSKLDKKIKKKINYLYFVCYFIRGKKTSKI